MTTPAVLFGQAYYLRFDPKLWAAEQPYAPLGALYAAACVREQGYHVAMFDAMLATSEDEWAAALERHQPSYAVIYEDSFNYLTKMCLLRMREAAQRMVRAARKRGAVVIVAGSDASDHPGLYLDAGAEVVVAGEGEITLVEVLNSLTGKSAVPPSCVAGVCMRGPDGRVVRTPAREIIRNLDTLPRPAWDLIDLEPYKQIWRRRHRYFSMNVSTTRGCPYHCNWCAKPIYGQRYTARSPEQVVDEIAWLKATYAPDHLWFTDDIFGLKPGWIERFAALAVKRDAVVPFKCLLRADGVNEAIVRSLKMAGCQTAWIGAESGSQRILDAMEKGTRVEQIVHATRMLKAAGIDVGFFLQFGYPGETREDVDRTRAMVRACQPDDIGISVSYPLPGTPFYERVKVQLGTKQNWVDSDDLAMMYRASYEPAFYRVLHTTVHAEFRARKAARAIADAIRHPRTPSVASAREMISSVYHALKLPWLRHKLDRLSRKPLLSPPLMLVPLLSPQAAATPSDPGEG